MKLSVFGFEVKKGRVGDSLFGGGGGLTYSREGVECARRFFNHLILVWRSAL